MENSIKQFFTLLKINDLRIYLLYTECPLRVLMKVLNALYSFFQNLKNSIADHKSEFDFVNKVANEVFHDNIEDNLQVQMNDLNTKWIDIPLLLEERCSKLRKGNY